MEWGFAGLLKLVIRGKVCFLRGWIGVVKDVQEGGSGGSPGCRHAQGFVHLAGRVMIQLDLPACLSRPNLSVLSLFAGPRSNI